MSLCKRASYPGIVRRRILLRGGTYACNFFVTVLPNLILDLLIFFDIVHLNRTSYCQHSVSSGTHGWSLVETIGRYLYCLHGVCNVGTYVFWIWKDERDKLRATAGGETADLERTLVMAGYFTLTGNDSQDARLVAEAICSINR